MADYSPIDYINDYSWVGEVGGALSKAALQAPELIKFNRNLHENNKFKDMVYSSVTSFVDGLADDKIAVMAKDLGIESNDPKMIKEELKKKIPTNMSEDVDNKVYGNQVAHNFIVPMIQAASKAGVSIGDMLSSTLTEEVKAPLAQTQQGKKFAEEEQYQTGLKRNEEEFNKEIGTETQPGRIGQRAMAEDRAKVDIKSRWQSGTKDAIKAISDTIYEDDGVTIKPAIVAKYIPTQELSATDLGNKIRSMLAVYKENYKEQYGKNPVYDEDEIYANIKEALERAKEQYNKKQILDAKVDEDIANKKAKENEPKSTIPLQTLYTTRDKSAKDAEALYQKERQRIVSDGRDEVSDPELKRLKDIAFKTKQSALATEIAINKLNELAPTGEASNATITQAQNYGVAMAEFETKKKMVNDLRADIDAVNKGEKSIDRLKKEMNPKFKEYAGYNFDEFFKIYDQPTSDKKITVKRLAFKYPEFQQIYEGKKQAPDFNRPETYAVGPSSTQSSSISYEDKKKFLLQAKNGQQLIDAAKAKNPGYTESQIIEALYNRAQTKTNQ